MTLPEKKEDFLSLLLVDAKNEADTSSTQDGSASCLINVDILDCKRKNLCKNTAFNVPSLKKAHRKSRLKLIGTLTWECWIIRYL